MTLRRNLFALTGATWVVFAGAVAARAGPVRITSGEHPGFSRLVLYFRGSQSWEFGRVEGGYEFRSRKKDVTYDLRHAFDLIPKTRIAALADRGDGRLFLRVECACYGDVFSLAGGEVVLDIIDGDAPRTARAFNRALPPVEQPGDDAPGIGLLPALSPLSRNGLPLLTPGVPARTWLTDLSQTADPPPVEAAPQAPPPLAEPAVLPGSADNNEQETPDPVAQTEAVLVEQIGRAASQGLLHPDLRELSRAVDRATAPPSLPDQAPKEAAPKVDLADIPPEDHVRIQTVYERDLPGPDTHREVTSQGLRCPPDGRFDIAAWGSEPVSAVRIGDLRAHLLGEFDQATPDAAIALAQYYIFLTFGSEARAVLNSFAPETDRTETLKMMADIVDNLVSDQGDAWARFQECSGNAPMWAILAQGRVSPDHDLNEADVYSAFSALPIHLRQRFGSALAERLVAAGRIELATRVRDAVQRGTRQATLATTFLDAQIAMAEEDTDGVLRQLGEVVSSRSGNAAQALIDLLRYKLGHDIIPTERDIELAASFAFEQQGTDTGLALQQLEIMALAHSSRFAEAFSRLRDMQSGGETLPSGLHPVLVDAIEMLTRNGSDAQFLRYTHDFATKIELPRAARLAVSERLLKLGFDVQARQILAQTAQIPTDEERRLLAQIALLQGQANDAIGYLAGLEDDASLALLARALLADGDVSGAMQVFERLGDVEMLADLAFRNGDWEKLAGLSVPGLTEAAKLALASPGNPPEAPDSGNVLAADTELLTTTDDTRRVLEELLRRFSD